MKEPFRMKTHGTVLVTALAFGLSSGACSSSSSPGDTAGAASTGTAGAPNAGAPSGAAGAVGSGGASSGGSGGGGGPAACTNVAPCGGSLVGTWTVASACLGVSGKLDVSSLGLDAACAVSATGSLQVSGSWTGNANGTYADNTTTTGTEQLALSADCLKLSGTTTSCDRLGSGFQGLGYSSVVCSPATAGGGCTCAATVQQSGGLGQVSQAAAASGNFTTGGTAFTVDGSAQYPYCVAGTQLTLTPQSVTPTTTGSVVLNSGSVGTGGAGGTGAGGAGTGGTGAGGTGAGGVSATGGGGGAVGTAGGSSGGSGGGGAGSTSMTEGPCDVYAAASTPTPCAAAYSTIRQLSSKYKGSLYQVRSGSSAQNTGTGGTTKDIGITAAGFADTATQDTFCAGSTCTFSVLYDQSGNGNNLKVAPAGLSGGGMYAAMSDFESSATKGSLTVGGHKVYSLYTNAREGYRLTSVGKGMPLGNPSQGQGIYMLADGTHSGGACCFDFGNVSTDPKVYGVMNTIFFGTGYWGTGAGGGPWFLGDFEGGVWAGGSGEAKVNNPMNPSMKVPFGFGIVKTSPGKYAIRTANLQTATDLATAYDGASPKTWSNTGGILLGIGSDNSNNSYGTFFEGVITNGRPSDATDTLVLKNAQAAGYGK